MFISSSGKSDNLMLPGVRVRDINKIVDERGFFAEIIRQDLKDFLEADTIVQSNLSFSFPGVIRAWHRHSRGQVDYITVIRGVLRICAYDDQRDSDANGRLEEIILSGERLQMVRIPGQYWHGTKTLGSNPSLALYFVSRLYDSENPDEERRSWNDPKILDPKTSKPYDWNKSPHK